MTALLSPPPPSFTQIYSIDTGSECVTALLFHPYHPLLCTADSRGFLRISNYNDSSCINTFHVTNGAPRHVTHESQTVCRHT